jgi:outer membrane protein
MKKIIQISLLSIGLFSSLNADIIRIEGGAGVWQQNSAGESSYSSNGLTGTDTVIEDEMNKGYAWVLFKQPIPLIPNLRLEYTNVEYNGIVSGSFDNFDLPDGLTTDSHLTIDQYDIIPYYNILDNTFWATIDVGLDIKILESEYTAASTTEGIITFEGYNSNDTLVVPLGYLRARVEIPGTDIGLESDIKYITYDGSSVIDFRAKVDYTFDMFPIVQPGIEIGYRYQKIDIDDGDGTLIDIDFSGVYAGLMVRF